MAKQVLLIDGWEVPKLIQYDVDWEPLWSGAISYTHLDVYKRQVLKIIL